MFIKSMHIKDYKSIKDLKINFNEKVNVFVGKNAVGKTNLLKAILSFFKPDTKAPKYGELTLCVHPNSDYSMFQRLKEIFLKTNDTKILQQLDQYFSSDEEIKIVQAEGVFHILYKTLKITKPQAC